MKTIFFLSLISLSRGFLIQDLKEPEKRIVGGEEVDIEKHGYQVSLRKKSILDYQSPYIHICGGSIYLENIVLTAAHCVLATVPSQLKVVAGSKIIKGVAGVIVPVKEIIIHENFNPYTFDNDVAILVLSAPLMSNKFNVRPIDLIEDVPTAGTMATVTGWGALAEGGRSTYSLQEVKVPIISNEECNEYYGGDITEFMLCAGLGTQGGKDACGADSGGPLIVRNKLAGIVSWGNGCARPKFPGVYANIATLKSWILHKTSNYQ